MLILVKCQSHSILGCYQSLPVDESADEEREEYLVDVSNPR